jgi:hypothetical protein
VKSREAAELPQRYATPPSVCANAVDKGVSGRFGVKAVDKGLSRQKVDSEQWAVGSISASALRDWRQGLKECENTLSAGGKEGRNGDIVSTTLTKEYPIRVYLSSDKLKAVD